MDVAPVHRGDLFKRGIMAFTTVLSHKQFLRVDHDYEQAAEAAHLVYVTDQEPGITRIKRGKGYSYGFQGKTVTDPPVIQRIRGLAIPPSWTKVWICPTANGHIQATGADLRG